MKPPESWVQCAQGMLPAIPARNALRDASLSGSLKAGLAAAAYRLKNGEGVWLSAPFLSPDESREVVRFCHQVRMEALSGQVRAPWMNRPTMLDRTDLIVWTRASGHFTQWCKDPQLGVQWVRGGHRGMFEHQGRILRTLVCRPGGPLTDLFEQLSQHALPFMLIVDITPFGVREGIRELMDHIEGYFPEVPVLILSTATDRSIEGPLCSSGRSYPCWRQQAWDATQWIGGDPVGGSLCLIELPDSRLENTLVDVLAMCRELQELLKDHASLRSEVLSPLYKVVRQLRGMAMPLDYYEQHLANNRRGGLYPVMPLRDWLGRVDRMSLPTGKSEQLKEGIVDRLGAVMGQLGTGVSGKQQALLHWLDSERAKGQSCAVLVGSEGDSRVLRDWLWSVDAQAMATGKVDVIGVASSRELLRRRDTARLSRALTVSPLWDSDTWALSLADHVDWLCYPRERYWQQRVGAQWARDTFKLDAGKLGWWQWESQVGGLVRPSAEAVTVEVWAQCSGEYAQYNTLNVELPDDPGWMAKLMRPPPERLPTRRGAPVTGEVSVTTEEGHHYQFHESQSVYILSGRTGQETLETVAACDLAVGDTLIELDDQIDAGATLFETLIEYAVEHSVENRTFKAVADGWHRYVDHALHRCGSVAALHKQLKAKGVTIGEQQLKNWIAHRVIGPNNAKKVVPTMANLSGLSVSDQDVRSVINAQSEVRRLHRSLGKVLKRLALASQAHNTSVVGEIGAVVDEDALVDMVRVEVVNAVRHYQGEEDHDDNETAESILRQVIAESGGRIMATGAAFRSVKECEFKDLEKFESCLSFLSNELYSVYGDKAMPLSEAIEIGKTNQIRFSGDTASTTRGRFSEYQRNYNGKTVNIGKHIGVGTSRDPSRCVRLHFHWDDDDQCIVIHHAGRHLPTSQG